MLLLKFQTAPIYPIKSFSKYQLTFSTLARQVRGLGYSPGVGSMMLLTN